MTISSLGLGKLKRAVFGILDRQALRWLIPPLAVGAGRLVEGGVRSLRYRGMWIHKFGDKYIAEPQVKIRAPEIKEACVERFFCTLYRPKFGDLVVDVGAGVGYETIYFSRKIGETGRLIAIEAHPYIYICLTEACSQNRLDNVLSVNVAIAEVDKTVHLESAISHHLGNSVATQGAGTMPVQATTLDQVLSNVGDGTISYLKMNIEGAEVLALAGARTTLRRTKIICVSCHDFKYHKTGNMFFLTKEIVEGILKDSGFLIVPRKESLPWLSDQVNAYNPACLSQAEIATLEKTVKENIESS